MIFKAIGFDIEFSVDGSTNLYLKVLLLLWLSIGINAC